MLIIFQFIESIHQNIKTSKHQKIKHQIRQNKNINTHRTYNNEFFISIFFKKKHNLKPLFFDCYKITIIITMETF